jgi:uncharacterized protein DUF4440
MKRCSTCNRTYTDPALSFCIDDGTPLTTVEPDDDATVVRPRSNESNEWNAVAYQPPGAYFPPGGEGKRRRAWPWILGIVGAFLLGILALSIAAIIMVPRLRRPLRTERAGSNINRIEAPTPSENINVNSNAAESINTPPPAEREKVLAELTQLENEWTVANLNADKKKLDQILADDYVGQSNQEGELQTKAEYIRTIERDTNVEKWDFSNLRLTLAGDRATLAGTVTFVVQGRNLTFDFIDKFVWRDGRWQATGSQLKPQNGQGTDL